MKASEHLTELNIFPCPFLAEAPVDWREVESAFSENPGLLLRQAWREMPETQFRGAVAKVAHTLDALVIYAEMEDDDVFNPVSTFNEPAFLRGDVVEVFVLPEGTHRYAEIHATPTGGLLQLRFEVGWREQKSREKSSSDLSDKMVHFPITSVLTRKTPSGWSAFLRIPFTLIGACPKPGASWRMAVCRYDHTLGAAPVLSSTAFLPKVDFHRVDEWNLLHF